MLKAIELPYALDALEPYYSKETLDLHYNILYKEYVNKTNDVFAKLEIARANNNFENIKCLEKEFLKVSRANLWQLQQLLKHLVGVF